MLLVFWIFSLSFDILCKVGIGFKYLKNFFEMYVIIEFELISVLVLILLINILVLLDLLINLENKMLVFCWFVVLIGFLLIVFFVCFIIEDDISLNCYF